jgi:hypothetical protein
MKLTLRTLFVAALLALAHPARAQWAVQTISLHAGWNAVFVEVQPEPASCETLFAGLPVESVWAFNRQAAAVQFIQDPANLAPGNPDWLTWLPAGNPAAASSSLFALEGRRAYLVKLPGNAPSQPWSIKGRPLLKPIEWMKDSLNFVGFAVAPSGGPTFQDFFAGSPAHAGQPIFRLNALGQWVKIAAPGSTYVMPGEAYWIGCNGPSTFCGPLTVDTGFRSGLDYGRQTVELDLRIKNTSAAVHTYSLTKMASAAVPVGQAALAGPVPLGYFQMNLTNQIYGWSPMPSSLEKLDLPPGQEWQLRLEVMRNQMVPSADPTAEYQTLLEVADDAGARWLVPVAAYGLQGDPAKSPGGNFIPASLPSPRAGLWVGLATLNKVSQPAHPTIPNTPQPVDAPAHLRLIIHVDSQGQARLLQQVVQMWKNGTTKPDPMDPTKQVVDQPGRYVLVTDESLLPNFSGAALIDGQPVGQRLSSAAFAFKTPQLMAAGGAFGAGTNSCLLSLDYNDPLNPFKHVYHPDHNNLDEQFSQTLPEGIESFSVQRQVQLEFAAQDPNGPQQAGWGDTQLGGKYRETITGIHRSPIYLEGTFRLQQASHVAQLNDQN